MLSQLRNPDGTRRRRRSDQPVYSRRRRRRTLITVLVGIAVLLVGGWYGVKFFQRLRLEGETFRLGVNRRISAELGCKVEFTRLHEGGDRSLAATEATLTATGGGLLESGKFGNVSAGMTGSSWFSNEWGIKTLSISSGVLQFNPRRVPAPADAKPLAAARESAGGFRWSISPEPDLITIDGLRIVNGLDLEWPSASGESAESLRGLMGGVKLPREGGMEGAFIKGTLTARGLPEIAVEHITWKLAGTRLEIPGASARFGPGPLMEITGHADLVPEGNLALKVSILDTQLQTLLPARWRERISGALTAKDCDFTAAFGKGPERAFSGSFTIDGALLNGIGFTQKLAHFLQRPDLSVLEFPSLSGSFKWSPSTGLELSALTAERESLLRLAGRAAVNSTGDIEGRLSISVSERALQARANPVPHPFKPTAEGWAGVSFGIGGTAAAITDDIPLSGSQASAPPVRPQTPPTAPAADPGKDAKVEEAFESLLDQ
jgi:hypothetical protein